MDLYDIPIIETKSNLIHRVHNASFIVTYGNKYQVISFAQNYRIEHKKEFTIHAEIHALDDFINWLNRNRINRKYKVDMIVIGYSKKNTKFSSSRPCRHCIEKLEDATIKYKFNLKNIYYSTTTGNIISEKFRNMKNDKLQHISSGNKFFK